MTDAEMRMRGAFYKPQDSGPFYSVAKLSPLRISKNCAGVTFDALEGSQLEQMGISIHQVVGLTTQGAGQDMVVLRVADHRRSSLDLLDYAAESLTGRNEKLYLPPLLFPEILAAQPWYAPVFSVEQLQEQFAPQLRALLLPALVFGSYPEVVTRADKVEVLANLAADYLFKDVLQLGLVKTPGLIRKLLQLLAYQVGAEVSVSELALTLGIARATVDRYLELLEQTFVIFRLPAFSTNPRKEIAKSHKVFFWDTGIRNALLNDFSLNPLRADIGRLWENWVVAEVAKQNLLSGRRQELYFWRSRAGSEVDLVIKEGEVLHALECKWSERKAASRAFSEHYGVQVEVVTSAKPLVTLLPEC